MTDKDDSVNTLVYNILRYLQISQIFVKIQKMIENGHSVNMKIAGVIGGSDKCCGSI